MSLGVIELKYFMYLFHWTASIIIVAQSKNLLAFGMYSQLVTFMISKSPFKLFKPLWLLYPKMFLNKYFKIKSVNQTNSS